MLSNMRDHLEAINEILIYMANEQLDEAADIAESRLGMSSSKGHGAMSKAGKGKHGAGHMAKFMPEGMRQTGTSMHRAASRFALRAQEGELLPAFNALSKVTSSCVACHAAYRIR